MREVQPWNDCSPIQLRPLGSSMEVRAMQPSNVPSILVRVAGSVTEVREVQPMKAPPILVRLEGSIMEVREVHSPKAHSPISVSFGGISREVREVQP